LNPSREARFVNKTGRGQVHRAEKFGLEKNVNLVLGGGKKRICQGGRSKKKNTPR